MVDDELRRLLNRNITVTGPHSNRDGSFRVFIDIPIFDIKHCRIYNHFSRGNFSCGEFTISLLCLLENEMQKNASVVEKVTSQNKKLRKAVRRLAKELAIKDRELEIAFNSLAEEADLSEV